MISTTPHSLMTVKDYLAYDDGTDTRYELVNGELVAIPPESDENNDIAKRLFAELLNYFPITLIGYKDTEIEVMGRRATCRLPDLLVHTQESKAALTQATRATIKHEMPPPALAIEVVSPGAANRARDYRYKHTEYAARGIAEYWIIDPEERKITVCQWVEGQYDDRVFTGSNPIVSELIPAWNLTVDDLFTSR